MKTLQLCAGAFISIVVLSLGNAQAQTTTPAANHKGTIAIKANGSSTPPAVGSGTAGQLTKWLGTDGFSFTIGDSIITESKLGLVGIGTTTPTSKLTVQGMIETKFGGFKFPDGTTQTTAGIGSIFHDASLTGNGASGMPLKIAVPLSLAGSTGYPFAIITATNSGKGGAGMLAKGGMSSNLGFGGAGIIARGGEKDPNDPGGAGGIGIIAEGGAFGGPAVFATGGGNHDSSGGTGLFGQGGHATGNNSFAGGGAGVVGFGGNSVVYGGIGVFAHGGDTGPGPYNGAGAGILAIGGGGAVPGPAGTFGGNVEIYGTISKSSGSFKIDHPLDPENKYLYHSFVESPDMMNIYNGNVTTDGNGDAIITLPDWFETLNKDFRYQLTVIGTFAQAIVGSEVKDNHFAIKTSAANVRVSWQVTGVRQDPFAKAHRISVEEDKPETERGYYLHPELFNQPEEKSIEWARQPQLMQGLKDQRDLIKRDPQKRTQPNQ